MRITRINRLLLALVLALGAIELFRGGGDGPAREVGRLFPSFFADAAARIHLAAPDGEIEFVRGESGWVCPGHFDHPAWDDQLAFLMRALTSLTTLDLLSEDAGRHGDYGLDGDFTRVRVWGAGGELLVDLAQGDEVPGRSACYVRRFGEDQVYRAPGLRTLLSAPRLWFDAAWMSFEPAIVTGIRITGRDFSTPLVLEREEKRYRWSRDGQAVATTRVQALLTALQSLYLDGVVAGPGDDAALGEVALRVELTLLDGRVLAGDVGADVDGKVRARRDPGGWVVTLPTRGVSVVIQNAQAF